MSEGRGFVLTKQQCQALAARHGYSCVEKGVRSALHEIVEDYLKHVIMHGIINADHSGRKGLNEDDADAAIQNIPQMPKGMFRARRQKRKNKKRTREQMEDEE